MGIIQGIKDRINYLKMDFEEQGNLNSVSHNLYALAHDKGALCQVGKDPNHYKFDNMALEQFTDYVAKRIGRALLNSTKATGITLVHGDVTDKGMKYFVDALSLTKAPVKKLVVSDFQSVTDEGLKKLPQVIAKKGITDCQLGGLFRVSKGLKDDIQKACAANQKGKISQAVLAKKSGKEM